MFIIFENRKSYTGFSKPKIKKVSFFTKTQCPISKIKIFQFFLRVSYLLISQKPLETHINSHVWLILSVYDYDSHFLGFNTVAVVFGENERDIFVNYQYMFGTPEFVVIEKIGFARKVSHRQAN